MDAIRDWLRTQFGSSYNACSAPYSKRNSRIITAGQNVYLLKLYESCNDLKRSIEGSAFANSQAGIRTPKFFAVDKKLNAAIFEFLPGTPLAKLLNDRIPHNRLCNILRELAVVTRRLHGAEINILKSFSAKLLKGESRLSSLLFLVSNRLTSFLKGISNSDDMPSVIHGDLWSGNIIVLDSSMIEIALVDFDLSAIGDPVLDLAKLYCRGMVRLDHRATYTITPPRKLWLEFKTHYGNNCAADEKIPRFHLAILYNLTRTINFYGYIAESNKNSQEYARSKRSMARISTAMLDFIENLAR